MKKLLCLLVFGLAFAVRLQADENTPKPRVALFTEENVEEFLEAEKAIRISHETAKLLLQKDSKLKTGKECLEKLSSRSSQAFVVKTDKGAMLYLTPEPLNGLKPCKGL